MQLYRSQLHHIVGLSEWVQPLPYIIMVHSGLPVVSIYILPTMWYIAFRSCLSRGYQLVASLSESQDQVVNNQPWPSKHQHSGKLLLTLLLNNVGFVWRTNTSTQWTPTKSFLKYHYVTPLCWFSLIQSAVYSMHKLNMHNFSPPLLLTHHHPLFSTYMYCGRLIGVIWYLTAVYCSCHFLYTTSFCINYIFHYICP
jgi:hypothetical protein